MAAELSPRKLPRAEVDARLQGASGWRFENEGLHRELTFDSFPDAIAFVTRLAFDAEQADHHPEILVNYKRVRVTWSTHSAGGVTDKDFAGVEQSDTIAKRFGA
jgi:4a-hydroxytetrahydrobiopterin dehydratase